MRRFAALMSMSLLVGLVGVQPASAGTRVKAISAGFNHTCALSTAGGVKCWGRNRTGQLGDGTRNARLKPVDVAGLTSGVAAISAGGYHTCALMMDGGVKCWGLNLWGEVGDGSFVGLRLTPVDVQGLTSGVAEISAGKYHTCALLMDGGVKCWGLNHWGEIGDGTRHDRGSPVDVQGLTSGVGAISAGGQHTCVLTIAGGVKCWGRNVYGELGDGTGSGRLTPVDVQGLTSGVAAISAGDLHTCALTTAGGVKCWGNSHVGQLGDGTRDNSRTPVDVHGLTSGVEVIYAGANHSCALITSGAVKCWGGNGRSSVGDGTTKTPRLKPVDVFGLASGVSAIWMGAFHSCALTVDGPRCWGFNNNGQLGDGSTTDRRKPVAIKGLR